MQTKKTKTKKRTESESNFMYLGISDEAKTVFDAIAASYPDDIRVALDFATLAIFADSVVKLEHINNVIKWISEEQFATGGKLKIGKECEVSDFPYPKNNEWKRRKLLAILPERIRSRYITESILSDTGFCDWINARPIASFVRPKIDGDVYSWEMEVAE